MDHTLMRGQFLTVQMRHLVGAEIGAINLQLYRFLEYVKDQSLFLREDAFRIMFDPI